jgi:hypothetical protein
MNCPLLGRMGQSFQNHDEDFWAVECKVHIVARNGRNNESPFNYRCNQQDFNSNCMTPMPVADKHKHHEQSKSHLECKPEVVQERTRLKNE